MSCYWYLWCPSCGEKTDVLASTSSAPLAVPTLSPDRYGEIAEFLVRHGHCGVYLESEYHINRDPGPFEQSEGEG